MCRALRLCAAIISEPVRKKLDTEDGILIIASGEERVKMDVYEWQESPDVREQAKAGRDPGLFADSKQGRGRLKICGGGNKE